MIRVLAEYHVSRLFNTNRLFVHLHEFDVLICFDLLRALHRVLQPFSLDNLTICRVEQCSRFSLSLSIYSKFYAVMLLSAVLYSLNLERVRELQFLFCYRFFLGLLFAFLCFFLSTIYTSDLISEFKREHCGLKCVAGSRERENYLNYQYCWKLFVYREQISCS